MNERTPRLLSRLRIFVPLAVLVLILAGTTAAFASGAFESNGSGFDNARDIAERAGAVASTTTTSLPDANDVNDDNGADAKQADQVTADVPDGTRVDSSEREGVNEDTDAAEIEDEKEGESADDSGHGASNSGRDTSNDSNSGHGGSGRSRDD